MNLAIECTEWFVMLTAVVMGLSHVLYPRDWGAAFGRLHELGRTGAFINGGLSLVLGSLITIGHPVLSGPGIVVTFLGWSQIAKGALCLLLPDRALTSIARGSTGRGFRIVGCALLVLSAWTGYCLYLG